MKRLSFYVLSLLAVILFTACNDKADSVYSVSMITNNRSVDGSDVVFSQGLSRVELNYTNMTIQITNDFKSTLGQRSITPPAMKLTPVGVAVYHFKTEANQAIGGSDLLDGYIDTNTGVTWFSLYNADQKVFSTSQLKYIYVNTKVTNPENGKTFDNQKSAYTFAIDQTGEKCVMLISNFAPNTSGSVQATEVLFKDLKVTPTVYGYIISAEKAEPEYSSYDNITNLNFVLDNQCLVINGTYKCNNHNFEVTGSLLPSGESTPVD